MKFISLFLSLILTFTSYSQGMRTVYGTGLLSSEHDLKLERFNRLDTAKGYVQYFTLKGEQFKECIKVDSVFEYEFWDYRDNNKSTHVGGGIYQTTLLYTPPGKVTAYRRTTKFIKIVDDMLDLKKNYTFLPIEELQEK